MDNINWIKKSDRINKLPPYLFFEIRKAKEEAARRGLDIIDLGEGDPEFLVLIGGKERIGHLSFAFVNPGDVVLVPSPGYPVYSNSTILAEGNPFTLPLIRRNNFFPDLSTIKFNLASKAKLIFLNYPNNPTSTVANKEFFSKEEILKII